MKIEEKTIYQPTSVQALACLKIGQMLSTTYRNIELFRFDEQMQIVYIFASEELHVDINRISIVCDLCVFKALLETFYAMSLHSFSLLIF